jgi:hypothetical protein
MNPDDLVELEASHTRMVIRNDKAWCACGAPWPCTVSQTIAELRRLRAFLWRAVQAGQFPWLQVVRPSAVLTYAEWLEKYGPEATVPTAEEALAFLGAGPPIEESPIPLPNLARHTTTTTTTTRTPTTATTH